MNNKAEPLHTSLIWDEASQQNVAGIVIPRTLWEALVEYQDRAREHAEQLTAIYQNNEMSDDDAERAHETFDYATETFNNVLAEVEL